MDSVTLITRQRRFGKTLTISMLKRFFSIQYYNESAIFEHLDIWKYPEYREIMGGISSNGKRSNDRNYQS